ncbi:RNA-directed DNA polymerase, eukaryota, reverse transcriptase zinc-binding domain protein [Tanacetum coccineum]
MNFHSPLIKENDTRVDYLLFFPKNNFKRIPLKLIDIVYSINGKKSNKKNDAMESEKDEVSDVFNGGDDDCYDDIRANGNVNNSSDQHVAKEWNKDNTGENRVDSNHKATANANAEFYAKAVGSNSNDLDKSLFFVPTGLNDSGEEAVIFEEELVIEDSKKWQLTVCGYFVGFSLSPAEIRYNLRRMWTMCHKGIRRAWYARVLVEMEASRGLLDKIEIMYKDVMNKTTMTKIRSANTVENGNEKEKVNTANNGKENDEEGFEANTGKQKEMNVEIEMNNNCDSPPSLEKIWRVNSETVNNIQKSTNKYDILAEEMDLDEYERVDCHDERLALRWQADNRGDDESDDEEDIIKDQMNENKGIIADEIIGGMSNESNQNEAVKFLKEENIKSVFCLLEVIQSNVKFYCTFVYANNSGSERRILWSEFEQQKYIVGNCSGLILGDFNVTMDISEHSAGGSYRTLDTQEFKDTMNSIKMEDICSNGFHFTWTKSIKHPKCNTLKKLDRMLVNEEFMQNFPKAFGVFLPYLISYHSPVVLIIKDGAPKKKNSFRFSNFITSNEGFMDILSWSKGNVFDNVKSLKDKLKACQENIDKSPHDESIKKIDVDTLNEYTEVVNDELGLLKQKAKVNWMKNGDKNTAFFHGILKARKYKNRVESICDESGNRFERDQVAGQFMKHFEEFLGSAKPVVPLNTDIFKNTLSLEEAEDMVREVSDNEIKEALFDINGNKASRPVKEFFKCGKLLGEINVTLIALIPKRGKLPVRYMGVPLLAKRLSVQDCKMLIDKVENKINYSSNKSLSYAGRIQLIASVLSSMQLYWASVYLLPNSMINDIDKHFKIFLWNSEWVNVVKLKHRSVWNVQVDSNDSWGWKTTMSIRDKIKDHVLYEIGKGNSVSVWYDKWNSNGPFGKFISQRDIYDARLSLDAKISEMINENRWIWPNEWLSKFPGLLNLSVSSLNDNEDKVLWITMQGIKSVSLQNKPGWI